MLSETVFKLFKNHKNQRSQIVIEFSILKIYNLLIQHQSAIFDFYDF